MSDENQIFEDEKAILLDHDYDGIQELDHPLPYWWIVTFAVTVIFGVPYFILFVWGGLPSQYEDFVENKTKLLEMKEKIARETGGFNQEEFQKWDNEEGLKLGAVVFEDNCVACHLEKGQGDIGPNLTDEYWIHANGSAEAIYKVAYNGVEEKGMPIWSEVLSKDELYQVSAFISRTIVGTNVEGKEPEGEKVE